MLQAAIVIVSVPVVYLLGTRYLSPLLAVYFQLAEWVIVKIWPSTRWLSPNHLTSYRCALAPIILILLMFGMWEAALICFLVAALLDHLDGLVARALNLITDFGKKFDPLADKILNLPILLFLFSTQYPLLMFLVLTSELTITFYARPRNERLGISSAARSPGKIKTFLMFIANAMGICDLSWAEEIFIASAIFAFLSLASQLISHAQLVSLLRSFKKNVPYL